MRRSALLPALLCLQGCLLYFSLGLLPVWTDELFTLKTVAHPIHEILPLVQQDMHPPLYFLLLHYWKMLPLPGAGVVVLRAFSAACALLATLLLDLLWTRILRPFERWLALALFALSPCLLLYGRMARSYSMQVVLVLVLLALLRRWMRTPRSLAAACGSIVASLALLYTHYVPGLAVLTGFAVIGWRSLGVVRLGGFVVTVAAGYSPWVLALIEAVRRWSHPVGFSASYTLSGSRVLEPVVKIAFGLVSFSIGESFFVGSLLLVPPILLLALSGILCCSQRSIILLTTASIIGFFGVFRWVSYPFIPARLLWLLPFFSLAVALGITRLKRHWLQRSLVFLILLSYGSSMVLYFRRESFLNMAYNTPLPEIANTLNRQAGRGDLILLDAYSADWQAISWLLSGRTPYLVLDPTGVSEARLRAGSAATVWIARSTRDVSPSHITTQIEAEVCTGRSERDALLEPFAGWQQTAMKIAGFRPPLTYFYQLTACGPPLSRAE